MTVTAGFLKASLLTTVPLISSVSVSKKDVGTNVKSSVDQRHDGNEPTCNVT